MGKGAITNPAGFKFFKFREQEKVSESREPRSRTDGSRQAGSAGSSRKGAPEAHRRGGSSGKPLGKFPEAAI